MKMTDEDSAEHLLALIGACALLGVEVENSLRELHGALAGPGPASTLTGFAHSVDVLTSQSLAMLAAAQLDEDLRQPAEASIREAKDAYLERNRIIHADWAQLPREPGGFLVTREARKGRERSRRTSGEVAAVNGRLGNAGIRIRSLTQLLAHGDRDAIWRLNLMFLRGDAKMRGFTGVGTYLGDPPGGATGGATATAAEKD